MGSDADPIYAAGVAPIHFARPLCAVRGVLMPIAGGRKYGAMCGNVGVGGRSCHYEDQCEHQRAPQEAKQGDK